MARFSRFAKKAPPFFDTLLTPALKVCLQRALAPAVKTGRECVLIAQELAGSRGGRDLVEFVTAFFGHTLRQQPEPASL